MFLDQFHFARMVFLVSTISTFCKSGKLGAKVLHNFCIFDISGLACSENSNPLILNFLERSGFACSDVLDLFFG